MPFSYGAVVRYHVALGVIESRRRVSGMVYPGPHATLNNPEIG